SDARADCGAHRVDRSREQLRDGRTPGLADRAIATRKPDIRKVRHALDRGKTADQKLPSPDRSVEPVAGAVEAHADRRTLEPVLAEAACHVRVMMLDGERLEPGAAFSLGGVARGNVVRVKIVNDALGRNFEQLFEVADGVLERPISGELLE